MAARAGARGRPQLSASESDQFHIGVGAVGREEVRRIESKARLHVDEVGPEPGRETALHLERRRAADGGRRQLSVRRFVDACRIYDFAYCVMMR